jgi:6-phosphogluconolactonase/glucosamine-6-phosphate isomerase/deaminase
MKFVRVHSLEDGVQPLVKRLVAELTAQDRVLWLVPGGSNIPLSVKVMDELPSELTAKLAIFLTDERYGPVGHSDSNTQQLTEAGFNPKNATVVPALAPGFDLENTCTRYAHAIEDAFSKAGIIIGQFGMGADGHIAGALPGSPAVLSDKLVVGYETESFTRITLTPRALKKIDVAYAFAFGNAKQEALDNLAHKELTLDKQPAQILRQIAESYVYNDQIGENEV